MATTETVEVDSNTIACDGGGGALGHPRVYLTLGPDGKIDCPYCGRHFRLKPGARPSHEH